MPQFTVTGPDGVSVKVEAPADATDADLIRLAQTQVQPAKASFGEKMLASPIGRLAKGMKDPIDAGAQLLPHALSSVASIGGLWPNAASNWLEGQAKTVDGDIKASEGEYQAARWKAGQSGFDGLRTAGNVVNPATLALARISPSGATSMIGRAAQGAVGGAVGGALSTPVTDTADTSFAMQKVGQGVAGAAGGAVFAPVIGKAVDLLAPKIMALRAKFSDPTVLAGRASFETSIAVDQALKETGLQRSDLPPALMQELQRQVSDSFKQGQKFDPAALLRKMDFKTEGLPALRGQITRDAGQYSRDLNMRGIEGVGEPIQNVLTAQNQGITSKLAKFGGPAAADAGQAGAAFTDALKKLDDSLSDGVMRAYKNSRASSGKEWEVPLPGLSHDVQNIVDDMGVGAEKNAVPSAIYNRLKQFGIVGDGMTQRKVFNYEEADKLLKQINAHEDGMNGSIGQLRAAVKKALLEGSGDGDPFAPARKMAASRFALLDAVPALDAVAKAKNPQEVSRLADDFVQKHIIGGKVADLKKLAEVLPDDAMAEAKKQIASVIYRGAFKGNAAGDKMVSPAGLQESMRGIGTDRLKVFFTGAEIEQLRRLTRISAYANSEPAWGTVARGGNPGGVLLGGAARLAGATGRATAALPLIGMGQNALRASAAMDTSIPKAANLSADEVAKLAGLLNVGSVVSGGLLAPRP